MVLDLILVRFFSNQNYDWGKNVVIFELYSSSSVHIDKKKKNILVLGRGPTQGPDDTTITAEAGYSINFLRWGRKFCLRLHYNGNNDFLFVSATKTYQFKERNSEIKP